MCIVSICPKGTDKNSDYVKGFIASGMKCNKDGSGFMFKRDGEKSITVDKGYFNIDDLLKAIESYNLKPEDELVVHHRISTAGLVSGPNSHPFVVSKYHNECASTKITTEKPCLAHNGIFGNLYSYMNLDTDFSDTYAFSRYVMSNPNIHNLLMTDQELFKVVMKGILSGSRVAMLHPSTDLIMIGDFVEDEGYYHSNRGYCTYVHNRGGVESNAPSSNWTQEQWDAYYQQGSKESNRGNVSASKTKREIGFGAKRQEVQKSTTSSTDTKTLLENCIINLNARALGDFELSNKVSLLRRFDGDCITITEKNFDHFYFVNKDNYAKSIATRKMDLLQMTCYDSDTELQTLRYPSTTGAIVEEAIPLDRIHKEFYFLPKGIYAQYYNQLDDLIKKVYKPGKKTLKKLENLLRRNLKKDSDQLILYKRHKQFYYKKSLSLYKDLVEDEVNYELARIKKYKEEVAGESVDKSNKIKDLKDLGTLLLM